MSASAPLSISTWDSFMKTMFRSSSAIIIFADARSIPLFVLKPCTASSLNSESARATSPISSWSSVYGISSLTSPSASLTAEFLMALIGTSIDFDMINAIEAPATIAIIVMMIAWLLAFSTISSSSFSDVSMSSMELFVIDSTASSISLPVLRRADWMTLFCSTITLYALLKAASYFGNNSLAWANFARLVGFSMLSARKLKALLSSSLCFS